MKQWVKKLLDQFGVDWNYPAGSKESLQLSEDRATLLYILDTYSKYLLDVENQPVRRVRETLDEFAKGLVDRDPTRVEKTLFRFRQFFSSYRIDEYTYVQNTLDDFKGIIWDFADQLSEDVRFERMQDKEVSVSLEQLREAVEANAIDDLRVKSREFIDFYVEYQTTKEERRTRRIDSIQKNLDSVHRKLLDANKTARVDHLTGAFNRRSFDEQIRQSMTTARSGNRPLTLIMLDIDYFKRINDVFGHDMGDYVIKECVRILQAVFARDEDFVARIGGEEFAVILDNFGIAEAIPRAEQALEMIRQEVILHMDSEVRFTISMGLAQLAEEESAEVWIKRADSALYASKNTGRDRYTVAEPGGLRVA